MGKIFFTSDLHFGHSTIIGVTDRPFEHKEEMDEILIKNWNSVVENNDIVYIIGDFCFRNSEETIEILKKLKGKKVLIKGNHEEYLENNEVKKYFLNIYDYLEIEELGKKIILFHYPISEWNGFYRGSLHLHGHQHNNFNYNLEQLKKNIKRYDVGIDANDYKPVSLEKILNFFNINN